MSVNGALAARLKAVAGVTNIIGSGAAARVHHVNLPQNPTFPAVVIVRKNRQTVHAMGSDPGVAFPRFTFASWGDTFAAAADLSDQVRAAISRYRGTLDGTEILDCFIEDERDYEETPLGQGAQRSYRVDVDFRVWHRE